MKVMAVIVASGEGLRYGEEVPKQYAMLAGKPVLAHSLEKFSELVDEIVVVINKKHEHLYLSQIKPRANTKYVFGGIRRQDSVYEGLKALKSNNPDYVLIHDAARPMVSGKIITDVIEQLKYFKAVDIALPIQDTIKQKLPKLTVLDRSNLYITQTPQGFHFSIILTLHEEQLLNSQEYTDDISLAISSGIEVGFVPGEKRNIKITTPEDLELCFSQKTRVSQ